MTTINLAVDSHFSYISRHPQPNRVNAGRALDWLVAGWHMLAAQPLSWLGIAVGAFAVMAVVSIMIVPLPIVGPLMAPILFVVLIGGMLSAARRQADGEKIRFKSLFDGLRHHAGNLSLIGVFYSIPLVMMSLVSTLAESGGLIEGVLGSMLAGTLDGALNGVLDPFSFFVAGWFVSLMALFLMILALICAPGLIMFRDCPPLDAMRLSLRASLHNLGAMLLFGLLLFILMNIAALTVVGVLVFIPLSIGALRQAHLDIFGEMPSNMPSSLVQQP